METSFDFPEPEIEVPQPAIEVPQPVVPQITDTPPLEVINLYGAQRRVHNSRNHLEDHVARYPMDGPDILAFPLVARLNRFNRMADHLTELFALT